MKKIISFLLLTLLSASFIFSQELDTNTYSFMPAQIRNINVNFAAGNVTVKTGFSDMVTVEVKKEPDASAPNVKMDGNILSVKTKLFSSFKKEQQIEITLPSGLELDSITLISASANNYVESVKAKTLEITTASGLVKIIDSNFSDFIKVGGASGKVSVSNTEAGTMVLSAVSGEILVEKSKSKSLKTEAVNGQLYIKDSKTDSFEAQCVSGNINIQLDKMITENSSVKTTGGNIFLTLPKGKGYKAIVNSTNGQFVDNNTSVCAAQCEDLISQYKNGDVEIALSTIRGKIVISAK